MKKTSCLFFLIAFSIQVLGQVNLVPNPSFEDTISCPVSINQAITTTYWSSYGGTPDYYNSCAKITSYGVSVPYNIAGYQQAATGHAYCGLITHTQGVDIDVREYIGTQLISPLVIGTKYYVSFKTCLAEGSSYLPFNMASNKIGVKFITYNFTYLSGPPVFNSAQVFTDSIITDTTNWTTIKGSFIADSNYTQILCGNFYSDVNTSAISIGTPSMQSYYLIDDVCVSTDSLTHVKGINEEQFTESFAVYPNPTSDFLSIKISNQIKLPQFSLLNSLGQIIISKTIFDHDQIDLTNISDGFYYIIITSNGKTFTDKIIVRH